MKIIPALLAAAATSTTAASRTSTIHSSSQKLDLGSFCLSPLFGSDLAHTSLCTNESHLPQYRPSKLVTKNSSAASKSSPWNQIGPCYRTTLEPAAGLSSNGTSIPSSPEEALESGASQEYCVYHSSNFAADKGVLLITTPSRAAHISLLPALSSDALLAPQINIPNPKIRVVPIPGKEYGVVATETIFKGENILSETATIMIDYQAVNNVPEMDLLRMQAVGVEFLGDGHRERFLKMSTHGEELDRVHKVEKILVTNAFDVEMDDDVEEQFYTIFMEIARMNHDCRPNVDYYFDPKTLTQHVTALRNIYPGEELTLSYINPLRTTSSRLARLKRQWGFSCSCSLCTSSPILTAASDARINQIISIRKELNDWTPSSRASPEMAELLISLYEQERIHSMLGEAYTHAAIEYNGVGDAWTARKYANLAVGVGLQVMRAHDGDTEEMRDLVEDPWGHWTWMLREKKRMQGGEKDRKDEEDEE